MSTERRAILMWWFNTLCKEQKLDRDDPGTAVSLTWRDLKKMDAELQEATIEDNKRTGPSRKATRRIINW